jgi:hypothetical protein
MGIIISLWLDDNFSLPNSSSGGMAAATEALKTGKLWNSAVVIWTSMFFKAEAEACGYPVIIMLIEAGDNFVAGL